MSAERRRRDSIRKPVLCRRASTWRAALLALELRRISVSYNQIGWSFSLRDSPLLICPANAIRDGVAYRFAARRGGEETSAPVFAGRDFLSLRLSFVE
jgi:hypothetical protein